MAKLTSFPKEIGYTDRDKARIWFSCHPDDFEKWFDVICKDIRECHADSIIWYKDDMGGMLEEEEYEKLATMPDVNQEMVGLFIQYCDEYAKYFTDIKEYCFKKCIEGYKIKKKRFGLSDEDERNRRKINEDLRLLKKSKRNS